MEHDNESHILINVSEPRNKPPNIGLVFGGIAIFLFVIGIIVLIWLLCDPKIWVNVH